MPPTPDPRPPARVHIVGGPGSGKTTLARRIAAEIGAPFFELDEVAFEIATGRARSRAERQADLDRILAEPSWVTEGNFLWWTDPLLAAADQVIWLDTPWPVALWRIVRRHIRASRAGTNRYPGIRRLLGFLAWSARYYLTPFVTTPRSPDDDAALSRRATARHLNSNWVKTLKVSNWLACSTIYNAFETECIGSVEGRNVRFQFANVGLRSLYESGKSAGSPRLGDQVVRKFFSVMTTIKGVANTMELRRVRSLHYEKLKGDREGQHSLRLTGTAYRLVVIEREDSAGVYLEIIELVDYH